MPMKAALTAVILTARRLLPVAALRAFLGRVGFIDFLGRDSGELGFVFDHPGELAVSPLMQPLVHLAAVVDPVTDAANITDSNRRDTSLKEHLHDLSAQLVKEVRDLVVDVIQLLVFRLDELRPSVRAVLFAIYFRIEFGFQLVLVVTKSAKLPAVDREGARAREDSGKVLLPEINSSDLVSDRSVGGFCVVLSTDDEAIGGLPNLNGSRLSVYGPVDQNRVLSTLRGQSENTVVSKSHALTFPSQHVVSFITALWRVALAIVVVPGADSIIELIGDCLGSLRGQTLMPFTVPPLHRRFAKPVVLAAYGAPVPLADAIPQVRRGTGQPLELIGILNVEFTGQIHTQTKNPRGFRQVELGSE